MKIAVIYNRESKNVINLFGLPNREKYGLKAIKRIVNALKAGGYQVLALEGDKDIIDRLEQFMPRVIKGERPGMVFNLSYGIQGQARYTHVPGILEMIGIPYVGSGPLAHSLALDKVVAKVIFRQNGLPTPDFAVLDSPDSPLPDLTYPLIVKPKNEAVSFGLKIVNNEEELRQAARFIFDEFRQAVLVEQYIDGREINVGLLGNSPPDPFLPAELIFGQDGPKIYTLDDKRHKSGREVKVVCPAPLNDELTAESQKLARQAFAALGCYDCARVDMRIDAQGKLYILELNSLPSLGEHGSYVAAAAEVGLDFPNLINRLVEVASARYFGTPSPAKLQSRSADRPSLVFSYLTEHRDQIEQHLKDWVSLSSRTWDPVGLGMAHNKLDSVFQDLRMKPVADLTDNKSAWTWETKAGITGGTLFVGHLDVPLMSGYPMQAFRRDPEWLYGEGVGISRAPLVMFEFALRALRAYRLLQKAPLGALFYTDEGNDARYSGELITKAASRARRVFVLRPGNPMDMIITERRGQRKYRLIVKGRPTRVGLRTRRKPILPWVFEKMQQITALSSQRKHLSIAAMDFSTENYPMLQPHEATVTMLMAYFDKRSADAAEREMRKLIAKDGLPYELFLISDRPPMRKNQRTPRLINKLRDIAVKWEIPLNVESSVWPSVAGLVPKSTAVVCGVGPVARELYTAQESVQRFSLMQRTLLLAQFLLRDIPDIKNHGKTKS